MHLSACVRENHWDGEGSGCDSEESESGVGAGDSLFIMNRESES